MDEDAPLLRNAAYQPVYLLGILICGYQHAMLHRLRFGYVFLCPVWQNYFASAKMWRFVAIFASCDRLSMRIDSLINRK